jgi:hypothetical protein
VPGEVFVGRVKDGVEVEEEVAAREEKDAIGAAPAAALALLVGWWRVSARLLGYWVILLRLGRGRWGGRWVAAGDSAGLLALLVLAASAGLVSETGWFGWLGSFFFSFQLDRKIRGNSSTSKFLFLRQKRVKFIRALV